MIKFHTRKQRRFIKIVKELGYSLENMDQPYNTLAVGIRGSGKTTRELLMVLFSKVDLISSKYEEQNSCIISYTNAQTQINMSTMNFLIRAINRAYEKKYNDKLFYNVQNAKQPNSIYVNNHQIRFIDESVTHIEGIMWKKFKDVYIDEFQLKRNRKEDTFWENLIRSGTFDRYKINIHLFGTDEGMKAYEVIKLFKSVELQLKVESMSLDQLSYNPEGHKENKNKFMNNISKILEFLLLK